jgi:hypothetical protein
MEPMTDVRLARSARMLDDPDLDGELLLVGLAFARFLDFGGVPAGKALNTNMVARCVWPKNPRRNWSIKRVVAADARTYQPPLRYDMDGRHCGAPMIRRDGPCGRPSTWSRLVTDWSTGEQSWLLACARHVPWYDQMCRENRETKPDRLVVPAANHGGILARHIPEFAWPKIWHWATDGTWVEHPEVEPWKPPTFTLVLGDGGPGASGQRAMLAPVGAS